MYLENLFRNIYVYSDNLERNVKTNLGFEYLFKLNDFKFNSENIQIKSNTKGEITLDFYVYFNSQFHKIIQRIEFEGKLAF